MAKPPVNTAAPKPVDPLSELANLLEAKESERAARLGNADAFRRSSPPPVVPPEPSFDPAAERFDRSENHGARAIAAPAPALHPVKSMQPPKHEPSIPEPANAAPPVRPVQPSNATAPRRKKVAPPWLNPEPPRECLS